MSDPLIDAARAETEAITVHSTDDPSKTPVQKDITAPGKDYPHLKGYFNLDNPTNAQLNDLKTLWDYFAAESENHGDVLYKLRQMENKLAMPPLGQNRVQYLADYVKVLRDIGSLSKERDSYQR